jgi:Anti-anti-sigma regulatory factor (antagonist of anti-sigma factor)
MSNKILEVYESGELTVVGFHKVTSLEFATVTEIRDEILEIIKSSHCKVIGFDLTGVQVLPSGMLGLLASLKRLHLEVHVFNVSEDIREVLAITKLDQVLKLHDVDVSPA